MAQGRVAFKATMEGDKEMLRKLTRIASEDKGVRKNLRQAGIKAWEKRVPEMQARTPEKTGRLKRSERMRVMVSPKKEEIKLSLLAGGMEFGIGYAHKVHETHKTQAKFMEITLREAAKTIASEIGADINLPELAR